MAFRIDRELFGFDDDDYPTDEAIKKTKDSIARLERVMKLAQKMYDLVNGQMKEIRLLGDYNIRSGSIEMLRAMSSRVQDAKFEIAELKSQLEIMAEKRRILDSASIPSVSTAQMRARKRTGGKMGLTVNPKLLRNIKKFTR